MADCCGGKNAGKPISVPRYLAGLGVFFAYHGSVSVALHALAVPMPHLRKVRDFHRQLFIQEGKEVLRREDINVGGPELSEEERGGACVVPLEAHREEPSDVVDVEAPEAALGA